MGIVHLLVDLSETSFVPHSLNGDLFKEEEIEVEVGDNVVISI